MIYYSDEDLKRDLERLNVGHNKERSTQRRYSITIGNSQLMCTSYEAFSLDVPFVDHKPSLGKRMSGAWNKPGEYNTLSFLFDVAFPEEIFEFKPVEFLAVQCASDDVLLVINKQHKEALEECLSHSSENKTKYTEACATFLKDISDKLYSLGFGSNYSFTYTETFEKIIAQFNAQIAQGERQKKELIAEIIDKFEKGNFLSSPSLTNAEKLKEYSRIIDFCASYIPSLAENKFKVENLYDKYYEFIDKSQFDMFSRNWSQLQRSFNALTRGASGEKKVYEVLCLFDDRIRILRDYVWGHEHDFIVITPYGISTIEVKNLRGDYILTETGVLKCVSSNKVKPKDVALQSKKHLETLRRNLNGCPAFSADVPLQEIICSAESNFTIRDDYHYIPVCYYNTVDKALFPENAQPVLNEKTMDAIEKYLLEHRQEAFKFDVFLPRGEIDSRADFIKCFADVASGYMTAQITQQ